jgi:hypothetical protein
MRAKKLVVMTAGAAFAAACAKDGTNGVTNPGPIEYCTAVAPIALWITVRDAVTGRALADSASGTFQVDTTTGPLVRADSLDLIGGNRAGTYSVTVQRPGYQTWTMLGVRATQTSACGGVEPVKLTAALQRQGS